MQTVTENSLGNLMLYNDIPVLKYTIQYPSFTSTCKQAAVQFINEFYASLAKDKENYCHSVLYPQAVESARYIQKNYPPFHYYEFYMNYHITLNSGCITSLYMEQYTFMGGAHGSTTRTSDTWNFATGERIQLKNLYAYDPMYKDKILVRIREQISELLKTSPSSFFDDYTKLLQNTFNPNSFYLLPNGVVIYFQQYDIAPYASGLPEFLLPYRI